MITQQQKLAQQLELGAKAMGLAISSAVQTQLLHYVSLLSKWNAAYNLTAIDQPHQMIDRHLLDSLSIAPWITGQRVLDVGSGAGLPGIPLALYYPEKQLVLLDSNGKKTRFLTQVVFELGLTNVEIVQARVENYQTNACFDNITARAFSHIANVLQMSSHLCCPNGKFLLMKGALPATELDNLPTTMRLEQVIRLSIPGLKAERHLIIVNLV